MCVCVSVSVCLSVCLLLCKTGKISLYIFLISKSADIPFVFCIHNHILKIKKVQKEILNFQFRMFLDLRCMKWEINKIVDHFIL